MHRLKSFQWIVIGLTICMLMVVPLSASAEESAQIPIYISQEKQQWAEQPFIEQGNTMVPMRALFEKLGFNVTWDAERQMATAVKGGLSIMLTINKGTAVVNQAAYFLEVSPKIHNNSTYIPLRFVSEAAGADVAWDETERSVQISFDDVPQNKIRKLIENVTQSSSFVQSVVVLTGGDGIKKNGMEIKEIIMGEDGITAQVVFEAGFTVSKAIKSPTGITISPAESVIYEYTCEIYKDSFDQWILKTQPGAMPYEQKEKKPFMG
ncbi:copper amine oxidase N-terminal domain-containing protein [Paenibacillus agricola]|uniref:Copper amine oxidase N-terminal domain-containing protein n=1 Tax=Paenibacillus agricola TaxID=2716264 RepID=A0ABX0J9Y0_9BACL|nr:copper amine oxidase N-terminal domain-containing protein [Paenibacillus agricola]NHN32388.1 copper amine oxidase N-terminal domain-containing protein [Paenibacillus agricola]